MSHILLVEDNPDLAFGLRNNLEFEGYQVTVAEDGVTGLARRGQRAAVGGRGGGRRVGRRLARQLDDAARAPAGRLLDGDAPGVSGR